MSRKGEVTEVKHGISPSFTDRIKYGIVPFITQYTVIVWR